MLYKSFSHISRIIQGIGPFRTLPKVRQSFVYENVLGTRLELGFYTTGTKPDAVVEKILAETDRLEAVFSRFKPDSELNKWLTLGAARVSPDLGWLLETSELWRQRTGGAFHPGVDGLTRLWQRAETSGAEPGSQEILALLEPLKESFVHLKGERATKLFPEGLSFNAIAKGRIVDLAAELGADIAEEIVLNVGGDLRHIGSKTLKVDIVKPGKVADNSQSFLTLNISNQAVASSGGAVRGFKIGGRHFSHVIDPRTGWPVKTEVAVSVIAPDCATADVLATAFSVMSPKESLELADSLETVGCLIMSADGEKLSNAYFDRHIA